MSAAFEEGISVNSGVPSGKASSSGGEMISSGVSSCSGEASGSSERMMLSDSLSAADSGEKITASVSEEKSAAETVIFPATREALTSRASNFFIRYFIGNLQYPDCCDRLQIMVYIIASNFSTVQK